MGNQQQMKTIKPSLKQVGTQAYRKWEVSVMVGCVVVVVSILLLLLS